MNLVLFGEDVFTATVFQSLLENNHKVLLVVCPLYNDINHKKIESIAEANNIEFARETNVNSDSIKNKIERINPDLLISVHLRKILSKDIFSIPKLGAINVHPSLLPKYRGLSPQHQAIMHGDPESGVTVHLIEEGVDTGDIIIQKTIQIDIVDYISDYQLKMLTIYKTIVVEAICLLSKRNFIPVKQNDSGASYFGSLKREDRVIDFSKSKIEILNLIRAVSLPYKGAFYDNFRIWKAIIPDRSTEKDLMKNYTKTGIYKINEEEIILRLVDGILLADDFEDAGN